MPRSDSRETQWLQDEYGSDSEEDVKSDGRISPACCHCCTWPVCAGGTCCCLLLLLLLYFLIGLIGGKSFVCTPVGWGWAEGLTACDDYWCGPGKGPYLTPQNMTRWLRWGGVTPSIGYKTNQSIDQIKCYSPKQFYDMEAFNSRAPYDEAYFDSRPDPEGKAETVKLMAWVLKTPVKREPFLTSPPPRVVVQHGVGSNQNNRFTHAIAYQLRQMGFDVLVPGFRNHGWSGKSKHDRTTWGWIYPYDLLGAWDYAVNDPEGKFGGAVDAKSVAIVGVSLGGLTTSTAFGTEKRVHAAWIDSGPASPYSELEEQIKMIPNPIRGMLMPIVYWGANWWTGVDIGRYIPEKVLPCKSAPYIRHVAVASSSLDTFVPLSEDNTVLNMLAGSEECYTVESVFFPADSCDGMYHGYEMYLSPDLYQVHMCKFLTNSFDHLGLNCDYCQLLTLPWYKHTPAQAAQIVNDICASR